MKKDDLLGLKLAKDKEESSLLNVNDEEEEESYVSPFDEEYEVPEEEDDEEEQEEEKAELRENRIKTYFIILVLLYGAFLGLGWHMTRYSGSKPQTLTFNLRAQQVFMDKMEEYIISLQNMHAESVDVFTQFDTKTLGTKEAVLKLQKIEKAMQEKKDELKDQKPPSEREAFHSRLMDVYSLAIAEAGAMESFATAPTEGKLEILRQANYKYDESSIGLFEEFERFYKQ